MTITPERFQDLLEQFELERLFNELGWERPKLQPQAIGLDGESFQLSNIAEKRGVCVFVCGPDKEGGIPPHPLLLRIDREVRRIAHEHLLIFTNAANTALTWLWVCRAPGQPTVTRTHTWHKGSSGESLRQKLDAVVWSLEEEEAVTLTDVITGLRRAFDRDRVTKRFYDRFRKEHQKFSDFIAGLEDKANKAWYASLMLNRLMFVYFIQRKGFLDGNENYLSDKLQEVQAKAGKGHFHSFYRSFLRRLFHEGFDTPVAERPHDLSELVGKVPHLNGGLFDFHELEESNPGIEIPDEAFERLFKFFDAYDWHLDNRPLRNDNEINPDVLGYIFEKYINQKQMGAYYTKEDITEYISKNTVIPWLLEQARARCKVAFEGDGAVWNLLQSSPADYLYPAMKTGVIDANGEIVPESALPDFVQTGMKDAKARMGDKRYNLGEAVFETADGERGTLPTETWREYIARRDRCLAIRHQLKAGEVKSADALITLNLNIRQFMQDVIDSSTGPQLLRAVWQAIVGRVPEKSNEGFRHGITVLDPTCGSGAFLFAALNILEPLYEACLDRMEGFIEDAEKLGKKPEPDFVKVLAEVGKHPSRRYFVYKSIILHNLFGVDIMPEAVEICKLRLFLQLVSQASRFEHLEPLPDIDFNIRTGNTLVGFATEQQFDESGDLASDQDHRDRIKADLADLSDLFDRFREQQEAHGGAADPEFKRTLRERLSNLSGELDDYLARDYGIDLENANAFKAWRESHQPFHWFAEFYGTVKEGGFNVVIGNPPFLEARQIDYQLSPLKTRESNAVHSMCVERACSVLSAEGTISMVMPIAIPSTQRMQATQRIIENHRSAWFSNFAWRPAKLFDQVNHALTIFVGVASANARTFSTGYQKWTSEDRDGLFEKLRYVDANRQRHSFWVPKFSSTIERNLLEKLLKSGTTVADFCGRSQGKVFHRTTGGLYWKIFTNFPPAFSVNGVAGSSVTQSDFATLKQSHAIPLVAVLSSNSYWWYYTIMSNMRDLNPAYITSFPVPHGAIDSPRIKKLGKEYLDKIRRNSTMQIRMQKSTGKTETQSFKIKLSKSIIDKIDIELASLYGLTDDELDFIINYDIKYRMGGVGDE